MNSEQRIRMAKWYGKRQGITGNKGGWLTSAHGHTLCQGWSTLYHQHRARIWDEFWKSDATAPATETRTPVQTKPQPNREQLAAIAAWAKQYGRNWKEPLRYAWMDGNYHGFADSHLLQQVRNQCGPSWLIGYTLPKPVAPAPAPAAAAVDSRVEFEIARPILTGEKPPADMAHCTVYVTATGEALLWSGEMVLPGIGEHVDIWVNRIGPGTVTGYYRENGYLGVMCIAHNPPEWLVRQQATRAADTSKPQWYRDGIVCPMGCEIALPTPFDWDKLAIEDRRKLLRNADLWDGNTYAAQRWSELPAHIQTIIIKADAENVIFPAHSYSV